MLDIDHLLNTNVTANFDTQYPVPVEKEYTATIALPRDSVKEWFRTIKRDDGTTTAVVNIPFDLQDEPQRLALGLPRLTSRMTIWLDSEVDGRVSNAKGKNIELGVLLKAIGQHNDPNWNFHKLAGAGPVKVMTQNQTGKDGKIYTNIIKVSKA